MVGCEGMATLQVILRTSPSGGETQLAADRELKEGGPFPQVTQGITNTVVCEINFKGFNF